jgi:hypothetical protein
MHGADKQALALRVEVRDDPEQAHLDSHGSELGGKGEALRAEVRDGGRLLLGYLLDGSELLRRAALQKGAHRLCNGRSSGLSGNAQGA